MIVLRVRGVRSDFFQIKNKKQIIYNVKEVGPALWLGR